MADKMMLSKELPSATTEKRGVKCWISRRKVSQSFGTMRHTPNHYHPYKEIMKHYELAEYTPYKSDRIKLTT